MKADAPNQIAALPQAERDAVQSVVRPFLLLSFTLASGADCRCSATSLWASSSEMGAVAGGGEAMVWGLGRV